MSFSYRKVVPSGFFFKTYGFKRVSPEEMEDIVERLQRQTYSREFAHKECFQNQPSPPRPSTAVCKRAESARSELRRHPSARPRPCSAPPSDTDVMFQRIRKPTLSYRAALGKIAPSYEIEARQRRVVRKPPLPKEQAKSIARVRRPTTAYKYRCGDGSRQDPDIEKYQNYDFSDDNYAKPEVVAEIIDRVRTPTIASEGGAGPMCPRRRDSIGRLAQPPKALPLVSGLPRSKNVDEIVDRLSQPTRVYIHNRCRPASAFMLEGSYGHPNSARVRRTQSARVGERTSHRHIRVPPSTDDIMQYDDDTAQRGLQDSAYDDIQEENLDSGHREPSLIDSESDNASMDSSGR